MEKKRILAQLQLLYNHVEVGLVSKTKPIERLLGLHELATLRAVIHIIRDLK